MTAEQKQGERGRNYLSLSEATLLGRTISARNLYLALEVLQDRNFTRVIVTGFKVDKITCVYHYGVKVCMFMIDLTTLSMSLHKLMISE
jgi:hypothetical protein